MILTTTVSELSPCRPCDAGFFQRQTVACFVTLYFLGTQLRCLRSDIVILDTLIVLLTYLLKALHIFSRELIRDQAREKAIGSTCCFLYKVKIKCAILHWSVGGVLISLYKTVST